MLKSCKYCGRIHDVKEICAAKPQRKRWEKKDSSDPLTRFRNSAVWQRKRKQIKERDKHCCQFCLIKPAPGQRRYNTHNLSVHHIEPMQESWEQRLDDSNLITLCSYHHEQAESGEINKEMLWEIIRKK